MDRLRRAFERKLENRLKRYFITTLREVAQAFLDGDRDVDLRRISLPLEQILLPHYREVIEVFGQRVLNRLELKFDFGTIQRNYIQERGGRNIVEISSYTKRQVNRAIETGLAENKTLPQIAKDIEGIGVDFSRRRSAVIARTETHNSSGYAHHEMHKEFMPPNSQKQWVATNDARTRSAHAAVQGQTVGIDDNFIVGGREMRYAGDYRGGAGNVINCRCTIIYLAPDDEVFDPVPETVQGYSVDPWLLRDDIKPEWDIEHPVFGMGGSWDARGQSYLHEDWTGVKLSAGRRGLSAEDAAVVFHYTTYAYNDLNTGLRGWFKGKDVDRRSGLTIDDEFKAHALGYRQRVKEVFEKLEPYKGEVHRGVSDKIAQRMKDLEIEKVGSVVRAESFWSTSYEKGAAFKKQLSLVINSKTGRQIDYMSAFDTEKEVLFLPGTEFRVTRIEEVPRNGKMYTVVYMDELGDGTLKAETNNPVLIGGDKIITYSRGFFARMVAEEDLVSINNRLIAI